MAEQTHSDAHPSEEDPSESNYEHNPQSLTQEEKAERKANRERYLAVKEAIKLVEDKPHLVSKLCGFNSRGYQKYHCTGSTSCAPARNPCTNHL